MAVRRQALIALADRSATEAVPEVIPLLRDVEIRVRQMAIVCLGEIASPQDQETYRLIEKQWRSEEASIRYQALQALCQISPDNAKDKIALGLFDTDAEVRELSLRLVDEVLISRDVLLDEEIEQRILEGCEDLDQGVRIVAQLIAGERDWEAPRDMIQQVVRRKVKVREARDEQMAILLSGRLLIRELQASLSRRALGWFGFSLDPFRWVALGALVRLGDEEAWKRLTHALQSRQSSERSAAVQSLGESGDPRAKPLLVALKVDGSWEQKILKVALENLDIRPRLEE